MRTIKFCAWDTVNRKILSDFIGYINHIVPTGGQIRMQDLELVFPLMQFTGLFDKHGKEIWEGDIIKHYGRDKIGYVKYFDKVDDESTKNWTIAAFLMQHTGSEDVSRISSSVCEVIGNVYENPELLNSKEI